jgi:diadenosine tetraphosphate (Ap4A) HIT family hydrolase
MSEAFLNETMRKFGAPATCIRRYDHWSVLLRPAQATLGSLVLAAHDTVRAFSELDQAGFTELHGVCRELEQALATAFEYDKLNYLMLMMVDPDVHFHVIPRYAEARRFEGVEFLDPGWPGPPALGEVNETEPAMNERIQNYIDTCWPAE